MSDILKASMFQPKNPEKGKNKFGMKRTRKKSKAWESKGKGQKIPERSPTNRKLRKHWLALMKKSLSS